MVKKTNIPHEERSIWSEIKKGNLTALGDLYDLYIDSLISYGISICGDKNMVMDCVHDLFVDIYKYKKNLGETNNIQFYLFTSLKRKIYKKLNSKELCVDYNVFNSSHSKVNYEKCIEEDWVENEQNQRKVVELNASLKKLTKKQQEGLKLRFVEDQSYEEIAKKLGVSVSSARTSIYRALKILRKHQFAIITIIILFIFIN